MFKTFASVISGEFLGDSLRTQAFGSVTELQFGHMLCGLIGTLKLEKNCSAFHLFGEPFSASFSPKEVAFVLNSFPEHSELEQFSLAISVKFSKTAPYIG